MNEVKAIEHLLSVTEELLFSFPLPEDLVQKYTQMRENAFYKANLKCNNEHIWRMQRAALSRHSFSNSTSIPDYQVPSNKRDQVYHTLNQYRTLLISFLNSVKDTYNSCNYCDKYSGSSLNKDIIIIDTDNLQAALRKFLDDFQVISDECENLTKNLSQGINRMNAKLKKYKTAEYKLRHDNERLGSSIRKQKTTKSSAKSAKREAKAVSFKGEDSSEEVNTFKSQLNKLLREKSNQMHDFEEYKKSSESSIAAQTKQLSYEMKTRYEAETENLAKNFKAREEELIGNLEKHTKEDSVMIKELREKIERCERKEESFRSILKSIGERLSDVFNSYIDRDKQLIYWRRKQELESISPDIIWQNYCDILAQIEIILSLLTSTSNLLLLKPNAPNYLEVILYSIKNSSQIMNEFSIARNKLLQVFEEE